MKKSIPLSENDFNDLLAISKEKGFIAAWKKYLDQVKTENDKKKDVAEISFQQFDNLIKESKCNITGEEDTRYTSQLLIKNKNSCNRIHVDTVNEEDGKPVECYSNNIFRNWGLTVYKRPSHTFIPKTKVGIKNIVKWARNNGKKVRASGYRHTWSDLYSDHDQVIISMLPLDFSEKISCQHPELEPDNELHGINIIEEIVENGQTKALCRIGAGVTNEHFRRWCLKDGIQKGKWTLPLNVIMVEICYGASNAPICHGAGWDKKTLSDLVHEIEFVNALGELQTVNSPELLRTAAGAFGLLGITTSITLKLDTMSYACLKPTKIDTSFAVPPIKINVVPEDLRLCDLDETKIQKTTQDFIERCENSYYAEWFWFPFQEKCWVNTWKNDGKAEEAVKYPSDKNVESQEKLASLLEHFINSGNFKNCTQKEKVDFIGSMAMLMLPDTPVTTPVIEALHFQRGLNNLRVYDMEFEIPIPARKDDATKPDWSICQRAWWDCISLVYKTYEISEKIPMDLTLEMRVMGGSDITMAPQFGNSLGTCSIEILSTRTTPSDEWLLFMQQLVNRWSCYTDAYGNKLNIRPHWAKQWQGLKIDDVEIEKHIRETSYKTQLPIFIDDLNKIAKQGDYKVEDMFKLFENKVIKDIFPLKKNPAE